MDHKVKKLTDSIYRQNIYQCGTSTTPDCVSSDLDEDVIHHFSPSPGSVGTGGRVCNRTSRAVDSCEVMCCGRGYDTTRVSRTTKCECKFHWCCAVHCRDCNQEMDVHTCKAQT